MYPHYPWTLTGIGPGDHLCAIYETEEEYRSVLTPFVRRALSMGEKVIYVAHTRNVETVLGNLAADGVFLGDYLFQGQLQLIPSDMLYTRGGTFDPDRVITQIQSELKLALAQGYSALCYTSEMSWAAAHPADIERMIAYEQRLNTVLAGTRALALCLYHRVDFTQATLLPILRAHPIAIIGRVGFDKYAPVAALPPARHAPSPTVAASA